MISLWPSEEQGRKHGPFLIFLHVKLSNACLLKGQNLLLVSLSNLPLMFVSVSPCVSSGGIEWWFRFLLIRHLGPGLFICREGHNDRFLPQRHLYSQENTRQICHTNVQWKSWCVVGQPDSICDICGFAVHSLRGVRAYYWPHRFRPCWAIHSLGCAQAIRHSAGILLFACVPLRRLKRCWVHMRCTWDFEHQT